MLYSWSTSAGNVLPASYGGISNSLKTLTNLDLSN